MLSSCAEAISSIMAKFEIAKDVHFQMCKKIAIGGGIFN
jgi:hypothetical protein